jgi:hypothetical protein
MYYNVKFRVAPTKWHPKPSTYTVAYWDNGTLEQVTERATNDIPNPEYRRVESVQLATKKPYTATAEGWAKHKRQTAS